MRRVSKRLVSRRRKKKEADWIELKESLAKFQAARRSRSDDKKSDDIISDIKSRTEAKIRRKPSGVLLTSLSTVHG